MDIILKRPVEIADKDIKYKLDIIDSVVADRQTGMEAYYDNPTICVQLYIATT